MDIKKYRVVCSQPQMSDEIYIDIAPDNGVIHDQIFFSRLQLHRQEGGQLLNRVCGSIYLQDNNGEILVEFPPIEAKEGSPDYEKQQQKKYDMLEPLIRERYQSMRDSGMESTLFVCGIEQMFEKTLTNLSKEAVELQNKAEKNAGSVFFRKHSHQIYPQTPQEERILKQKEEFISVRVRRITGEQKRASDIVPAWRRFQKEYSGD